MKTILGRLILVVAGLSMPAVGEETPKEVLPELQQLGGGEFERSPGPADSKILSSLLLKNELEWYLETDVGTMHFYDGQELWSVDLLNEGSLLHDPTMLAGANDIRTVHHVAVSNVLLVFRAEACPGTEQAGSVALRSCAIDLFSGAVLWERAPLQTPTEVIDLPELNMVVAISSGTAFGGPGIQQCKFTAIDLGTGAVRWSRYYAAQNVWVNGPYLELDGKEVITLDAATGWDVRKVSLPDPAYPLLMASKSHEKILAWDQKKLVLYAIPTHADERLDPTKDSFNVDAHKMWEIKSNARDNELQWPWGPRYVADNLLLLDYRRSVTGVDLESGRTEWILRKSPSGEDNPFRVSPDGVLGAHVDGSQLLIVNMKSGERVTEISVPLTDDEEKLNPNFDWVGNSELTLSISKQKSNSLRFVGAEVSKQTISWTTASPSLAQYAASQRGMAYLGRRESEAKKGIIATTLGVLLPTLASGKLVVPFFGSSSYVSSIEYGVPVSVMSAAPDTDAGQRALTWYVGDRQRARDDRAFYRYLEFLGRGLRYPSLRIPMVSGGHPTYEISMFNATNGDVVPLAKYAAPMVHGIAPLPAFGIAITFENDLRRINVISIENEGEK